MADLASSFRARSLGAIAAHPAAAALALGALVVLVVALAYRAAAAAGAASKSKFEGDPPPAGPTPAGPAPAPAPAPASGPCRRQWSPAAIAEAQGLATAGGLGYFDSSFGEGRLVSAANFAEDTSAGLTDEALMNLARFGDAP